MSRYTVPEVQELFSPRATLTRWREVEIAVLMAQRDLGLGIKDEWVRVATTTPGPSTAEWQRHEAECGHEMVAFLRAWGLPTPVHIGLTTSDVVDTAMGIAWRDLDVHLARSWRRWVDASNIAYTRRAFPMLVRTHGQPAVVADSGVIWSNLLKPVSAAMTNIRYIMIEMQLARIAGPAGDHGRPIVSWEVQEKVGEYLSLGSAHSLNQVADRSLLAAWAAACARFCTAIEAVATVIWLGCHDGEITLVETVGSSSMVHKQNPTLAERLMGIARMARSHVEPLTSGMVHLHQRDLSHSSVERVLIPELAGLTAYALDRGAQLLESVRFNDEQIQANIAAAPDTNRWRYLIEAQLDGHPYDKARQIASERQA